MQVRVILDSDTFWLYIKAICKLLEPLSQAVTAIQSSKSTLADVTRYWLYLARALQNELPRCGLPEGELLCQNLRVRIGPNC